MNLERPEVVLQPFELILAEGTETSGLQRGDVHETNEVHAILVEAVPAAPLVFLP